jgi:hypothetical protein
MLREDSCCLSVQTVDAIESCDMAVHRSDPEAAEPQNDGIA